MREMVLRRRNGQTGILRYDDADAGLVESHSWYLNGGHKGRARTIYAVTMIDGKQKKLHRLLMGEPQGLVVDHADGDGLNNCRSNLRVMSHGDNLRAAVALYGRLHERTAAGLTWHFKRNRSGGKTLYVYDRATKRRVPVEEAEAILGHKIEEKVRKASADILHTGPKPLKRVAGAAGFEPAYDGTKNRTDPLI